MSLPRDRLGAWAELPFFETDLPRIETELAREVQPVLPPRDLVFAALERTQPDATRVVILGQDPYPTQGHANGLAFSVAPEITPLPRSLANIYRELEDDQNARPPTGDLGFWADQGVLLLNTALSVAEGNAGAHAKLGWQRLTEQVLRRLSMAPRAFLLWGRHAQLLRPLIEGDDHMIIETAHPSPLSARRGFFGSRPFSRVNDWLADREEPQINWTTP